MAELPRFWFGPPPELQPDEEWVSHHPANRSQGKRAVGGGLHISTKRVLFTPNVMDGKMGGQAWQCQLVDIRDVGVEDGRFSLLELFSGGLRDRLRLDMRAGGPQFFNVYGIEERVAALHALLAQSGVEVTPTVELPEARVVKRD